jgi:hypothetical protein
MRRPPWGGSFRLHRQRTRLFWPDLNSPEGWYARSRCQRTFDRLERDPDICSRDRLSSPINLGAARKAFTLFHRLIIVAAWASVAVIAYATLTDVGFVHSIYYKLAPFLMWPAVRPYTHVEHVIAFAAFGALFSFAYPKRIFFVCCVVLSSAVILECLQTLTPDRHGTMIDASEKIVGGALGIIATRAALYLWHLKRLPQSQT